MPDKSTSTTRDKTLLFAYFRCDGEDGLHLATSADGYHWRALNGDRSLLAPEIGSERLMRDPFILRGPGDVFHLVWTCGWSGHEIGYARSRDLIHWSDQRALPVMAHEPLARNCWAPEIAWDSTRNRFLVFWSSTIPGRFPETDHSGDDGFNHRIYAAATADFQSFTPTRLLFDPGHNVIDAAIWPQDGRYALLFKDETRHPVRKNLRVAFAEDIEGPYANLSAPFTESWVEGPTVAAVGADFLIYFDCYTRGRYGAVRTPDFAHFEDVSDRISFPPGTRHGAVFTAPAAVVSSLL